MGVVGADIDELRTAATRLTGAADQLQKSAADLNTSVINRAIWTGRDAEGFRTHWNSSSMGSMNSAITALRAGADALRRNADAQEAASRGVSGAISGGQHLDACYEPAPSGLRGLWDEVQDTPNGGDMSGYRIQKVVDAAGTERYIVYIGGTTLNPFDHQSWGGNVAGISGVPDKEQLAAINRLIPDGAEVMLVGYSQGGIDAQNIAASGALGNITQIVTFGSPVRNGLDTPAVHFQYPQDIVPSAAAVRPDLWSGSPASGNENVRAFMAKPSLFTVFGLGEHGGGYGSLADEWDKTGNGDADPRFATAASGMSSFRGDVVAQVDIKNDGTGSW